MKFQFKITTWEEVTVDEDQEQKVLDAIKDGTITTANDIFNFLADDGDMNVSCNKIDDVDEQMTVNENGGCSTIEVMEDGEHIYTNTKGLL